MGSIAAMDLAKRNVEIGIGDIDYERANSVARKYDGSRAFKVNATDSDELVKAFKGYDAVVNASWYEFNLHVMKACITAKCDYDDLGGLFHMTRKQLALHNEAKTAGISAIVGGGESPGITNVMCAFAAEDLDTVESIRIFCGSKESPANESRSDSISFPFSVSTVIDEYSKNPVEFIDGKYVEKSSLSGDEVIDFPPPVGKNICHYSLHSEPVTLPSTINRGVKNVEFKLGISEKMLNTLRPLIDLGLTSETKMHMQGMEISPKEFLVSFLNSKTKGDEGPERFVALKTIVRGKRHGKHVMVTCDLVSGPIPSLGVRNATAYLTGVAGSAFGQFLASGKVKDKGVIAPETAVVAKEFLRDLEERQIRVKKTEQAT